MKSSCCVCKIDLIKYHILLLNLKNVEDKLIQHINLCILVQCNAVITEKDSLINVVLPKTSHHKQV